MPDESNPSPKRKARQARKSMHRPSSLEPPATLTPTLRLDEMTLGRIQSLETDKSTLDERLEASRNDLLHRERENAALREQNAVLEERLADQRAWDVLATVLVGFGGLLSGAAAYLPKIGATAGMIGFGLFAAGLIMQTTRLYRTLRVSQS
jgi:hypothetical protein